MFTQPHIVLMDCIIPEKNGVEVCAFLRAKGFNNMIKDVEYHASTLELISATGKTELKVIENRRLVFLYKHRNVDVLREDLMTAVWGFESDMNT